MAAGGAALALDRGPAWAQKRELTFISNNHFVPASDDELRRRVGMGDVPEEEGGFPARQSIDKL